MFNFFTNIYIVSFLFFWFLILIQNTNQEDCKLFIEALFGTTEGEEDLETTSVLIINQTNTEATDNHLPIEACDYRTHAVAKRINPYKNYENHVIPRKMFGSVCLRCATCLAIAQEMSKVLEGMNIGYVDPNKEIKQVENALQEMCENNFKKFDLRNCDGCNFITEASVSTTHIPSDMDGKWSLKLEEVCSSYISHINMHNFYNRLLSRPFGIANFLCRGDGIFRDCRNVAFKTVPVGAKEICKHKGFFC